MIRILVDSSSDYTLDEIRERNMEFVPLNIIVGESQYADGVNLTKDDFYELLENGQDFPKTSQPSPQEFLDVFNDVKEKGDDLICILLSSSLSGTYQSASLAKDIVEYDNIYLIDSLSATHGIRIMAEYARKLAEEGIKPADIVAKVEDIKPRIKILAALDTLEYLKRGGRISAAAATIGELANIKPIITVTQEGKVDVIAKCVGKNKAISYIMKQLQQAEPDFDFPFYSLYTHGTNNCRKMEEKISATGVSITDCLQVGATIGTHIGPEVFAIIYVTK